MDNRPNVSSSFQSFNSPFVNCMIRSYQFDVDKLLPEPLKCAKKNHFFSKCYQRFIVTMSVTSMYRLTVRNIQNQSEQRD